MERVHRVSLKRQKSRYAHQTGGTDNSPDKFPTGQQLEAGHLLSNQMNEGLICLKHNRSDASLGCPEQSLPAPGTRLNATRFRVQAVDSGPERLLARGDHSLAEVRAASRPGHALSSSGLAASTSSLAVCDDVAGMPGPGTGALGVEELREDELISMDCNDRQAEDISNSLLQSAGNPIVEPNPERLLAAVVTAATVAVAANANVNVNSNVNSKATCGASLLRMQAGQDATSVPVLSGRTGRAFRQAGRGQNSHENSLLLSRNAKALSVAW
ncbi:unnamed protein product [Protopolystoma xenopodis]|uniref:Uncharacterized protein n=1 Tax=Protopolystoma xenopodis TaxID=117903 RepID=A0A3S5CGL5_9PLAT|nr:unnamed protein product [Protopolystoma xenopodis]